MSIAPLNTQKARIITEHVGRFVKKRTQAAMRGGHFALEDLFLYVTSRCNATCGHCFFWKELNRPENEIQVHQAEKLVASLPYFENLILTGGEPFLRDDLEDIIGVFAKSGKVEAIQINTNGFQPEETERRTRYLLEKWPDQRFQWMVSIDGYEHTHNLTRNNPRAWELTNDTLTRLTPLMRGKYAGQFYLGALTVLHAGNYKEIEQLALHIRENYGIIQAFELVRGTDFSVWGLDDDVREDYNPPGMELPPEEAWDDIWQLLNRLNRESGYLNRFFHLMTRWQFQMLREKKRRLDCVSAGRTSGTLYANGDVAACEFSKPFANLKDFDWDFDALWHSDEADARRAQLGKCFCTHACYLTKNLEYSLAGQISLAKEL